MIDLGASSSVSPPRPRPPQAARRGHRGVPASRRATWAIGIALVARTAAHGAPPNRAAAAVVAVDDDVRVRRRDVALATGTALPASGGGEIVALALRGETVAFQVIAIAGARPIAKAALAIAPLTGAGPPLHPALFREHYLPVERRSRNDQRPLESLSWVPDARPPDNEMLGDVPDALIPVEIDATPVAPGPAVPARRSGAFWVDVFVPEAAPPGEYSGAGELTGDGAPLARFTVRVRVSPAALPYRPASAFVYYEAERLGKRLGDAEAGAAERQLWQLLHAHHIDALSSLARASEAERLGDAYDGSLFRAAAGYDGPGVGLPPAVVALGAYGVLGPPRPESLGRVDEILARLPLPALGASDVFLYAIDERCTNPRAAAWKAALRERPAGARVLVGQTCDGEPVAQGADIAIVTPGLFARRMPAEARAAGLHAWIYNGSLPHTGVMVLDADPRGLIANGWIAAVAGVERWFYWESTFWDDDNRGGHGPVDPFETPETFHNSDGDTALGDGLLLYPGRQRAPFAAHSLGYPGVLPSLRLKALRRGIQDAGIVALAARERPADTARIVAGALPTALDEAMPDRRASWETAGVRFADARSALRGLITNAAPMSGADVRATLEDLAARRRDAIGPAPSRRQLRLRRAGAMAGSGLAALMALGGLAFVARRRRREKDPHGVL